MEMEIVDVECVLLEKKEGMNAFPEEIREHILALEEYSLREDSKFQLAAVFAYDMNEEDIAMWGVTHAGALIVLEAQKYITKMAEDALSDLVEQE